MCGLIFPVVGVAVYAVMRFVLGVEIYIWS
jgi:hypothetical protein